MPSPLHRPNHAKKIKRSQGEEFFSEIGAIGGSASGIAKGFSAKSQKRGKDGMTSSERARYWGKINGAKNKGKKHAKKQDTDR